MRSLTFMVGVNCMTTFLFRFVMKKNERIATPGPLQTCFQLALPVAHPRTIMLLSDFDVAVTQKHEARRRLP